jgi:hypothetical protein
MGSVADELVALERGMWEIGTRGNRHWMDAHLADDFVEYGRSGRIYDKQQILDAPVGPFRAELDDLRVARLSKVVALVTYRSTSIFGDAPPARSIRSSIWVRDDDGWKLRFHQGTPSGSSGSG